MSATHDALSYGPRTYIQTLILQNTTALGCFNLRVLHFTQGFGFRIQGLVIKTKKVQEPVIGGVQKIRGPVIRVVLLGVHKLKAQTT